MPRLTLRELHVADAVSRDPEFGWARAEIKRVFGLNEEFFKSSNWPIDEVHDAITSMQVCGHMGCGVGVAHLSRTHACLFLIIYYAHPQAHGKTLPAEMTNRLVVAINRLATREWAAYTVSDTLKEVNDVGRTSVEWQC